MARKEVLKKKGSDGNYYKVYPYTVKDAILDFPDIPSDASEIATNSGISESKNVQSDLSQIALNIGSLSDLETTAKSNLVEAINEAAQSGGSSGGGLKLIKTITLSEAVASIEEDLGGNFNELIIEFSNAISIVDSSGTGVADYFAITINENSNVYGSRVISTKTTGGSYPRTVYIHLIMTDVLYCDSVICTTGDVTSASASTYNGFLNDRDISKIKMQCKTSSYLINANTIKIYGR